MCEDVLARMGKPFVRGDGNVRDFPAILRQFERTEALLFTCQSVCAGVSITAASNTILLGVSKRLSNDHQAKCRTHRQGQTNECTVVQIIRRNCAQAKLFLGQLSEDRFTKAMFTGAGISDKVSNVVPELPEPELPEPELPEPELPEPDLPELPEPDLPELPEPELPEPDLPEPALPATESWIQTKGTFLEEYIHATSSNQVPLKALQDLWDSSEISDVYWKIYDSVGPGNCCISQFN
jgi:hypothetical protein